MKYIFILIFAIHLFVDIYPSFTNKELKKIKINSGQIANNRVNDYIKTIKDYKKLPKAEQLIRVNTYLNQLLPQVDKLNQKCPDYWETPKEFLTVGYGDCEDYAIIKYYTLLKLGFSENRLFMTTVYEKLNGSYHMVLSYFESFKKPPLILDNLSFRVLNLKQRDDLTIDKFINSQGVFRLNKKNKLILVADSYKKFENLLKKINKEKF